MAQHEHGRQEQSLTIVKGLWFCILNQRNGQFVSNNSNKRFVVLLLFKPNERAIREQRFITAQNRDDKSAGGEMREDEE